MNKVRLFLLVDGVIIVFAVAFLFSLWMRRKTYSNFKDDLWEQIKAKHISANPQVTQISRDQEDKIDQKILLEDKTEKTTAAGGRSTADYAANPQGLPFRLPNFRGKPHEILGISSDAPLDTVEKAYKFWIKKYHPDRVSHLGAQPTEQARQRSEQLNAARQYLLTTLKTKRN